MSDETNPPNGGDETKVNPLDGRLSAIESKTDKRFDDLAAMNQAMLDKLNSLSQPARRQAEPEAAPAGAIDPNLMYSNPALYTQKVIEQAEANMSAKLGAQNTQQQRHATAIQELTSDYPELNDRNDPLTKRTLEIYQGMPEYERNNTASYKAAARQAAVELDVKPKSRRPVEDFVEGSAPSGRSQRRPGPAKLDPATEEFARLIGVDTENPEVRARLIKRSERSWTQTQSPLTTKKRK